MFLSCDMTSIDHMIKGTCDWVSGCPSILITTMPNLILVSLVEVEICFYFVTWLYLTT